jgi:hypothetical protein
MNQDELNVILQKHKDWLDGAEGGIRANLISANLWRAELEAAQRWIPVSEPPKIDGTYLLRNIYEDVYSCDFIADTNTWVLSEYDSITQWMPLPKLPEVQE